MKLKILPWEKDEWLSKQGTILPFDKLEHFLIALIGVLVGVFLLNLIPHLVIIVITFLGIGWEIRDGLITSGQGFSWKDLFADFAGIALGFFLSVL